WVEVQGNDRYRRGVYTFPRRAPPHPGFTNFDVPHGGSSCGKRGRADTPPPAPAPLHQALFMDCAPAPGIPGLKDGGKSDDERIAFAFRCCTSRRPTDDERAELVKLLAGERERIQKGEVKAAELTGDEKALNGKLPDGASPADAAAFTIVARVIL